MSGNHFDGPEAIHCAPILRPSLATVKRVATDATEMRLRRGEAARNDEFGRSRGTFQEGVTASARADFAAPSR